MTRIALVGAIVAAALSAGLLSMYKERFEREVTGGAKVEVLLATRDIPLGAKLSAAEMGVRLLPESYVERRHVRSTDAQRIIGVKTRTALRSGEALMWSDLATTSPEARDLAALIEPGMRAISVSAHIESSFNNLLRPGDRVDAMLTTTRPGSDERVTFSLLQNLLVLAVGDALDAEEGRKTEQRTRRATLTLNVTMEQAQTLISARDRGLLTMVLRNPDDVSVVDDLPETTIANILEPARRKKVQRSRPAPPPPPPPKRPIRVD
jgi:pilus assembly protein CpaB